MSRRVLDRAETTNDELHCRSADIRRRRCRCGSAGHGQEPLPSSTGVIRPTRTLLSPRAARTDAWVARSSRGAPSLRGCSSIGGRTCRLSGIAVLCIEVSKSYRVVTPESLGVHERSCHPALVCFKRLYLKRRVRDSQRRLAESEGTRGVKAEAAVEAWIAFDEDGRYPPRAQDLDAVLDQVAGNAHPLCVTPDAEGAEYLNCDKPRWRVEQSLGEHHVTDDASPELGNEGHTVTALQQCSKVIDQDSYEIAMVAEGIAVHLSDRLTIASSLLPDLHRGPTLASRPHRPLVGPNADRQARSRFPGCRGLYSHTRFATTSITARLIADAVLGVVLCAVDVGLASP